MARMNGGYGIHKLIPYLDVDTAQELIVDYFDTRGVALDCSEVTSGNAYEVWVTDKVITVSLKGYSSTPEFNEINYRMDISSKYADTIKFNALIDKIDELIKPAIMLPKPPVKIMFDVLED